MERAQLLEDRYFREFMEARSTGGTKDSYFTGWRNYLEFYREVKEEDVTPTLLLERAVEDRKRPLVDQGQPEREFSEWASWLMTGYRLTGRDGKKTEDRLGLSPSGVRTYAAAVRSFYSYHGYALGKKARLPREARVNGCKIENTKIEYRPEQVKKLLSAVRSLRDRAIVLIMFQSGMDISTVCSLDYGHVKEELEAGKEPLLIRVVRPKVGLNYRTLIGRDAIEALKAYLEDRTRRKGEKLGYDTPLFMQEGRGTGERCGPKHFQDQMRDYVLAAGLVSRERLERADLSPARPHALRSGFSSILRLKGANERLIDYWMGHADPYGGAYNQAGDEELREFYKGFEQHLSISGVSSLGEVEERLKKELDKRDYTIKGMEGRIGELEKKIKLETASAKLEALLKVLEEDPKFAQALREATKGQT